MRISERLLGLQQSGRFLVFVLRKLCKVRVNFFDIVEIELRLLQPLCVWLGFGEILFEFFIFDDAPLIEVDQQHFARLQTPFAHDIFFCKWEHAALRCQTHDIILGNAEARRAQTVAIQGGTNLAAIGKRNCRRAVPWFHQSCVIFVKCPTGRIHLFVLGPGFRDQHHHCMRKAIAACKKQFERIVETSCVRLAMRDQRPHLVEVRTKQV